MIFYILTDEEYKKSTYNNFRGGFGFYKKNPVHIGFIRINAKGWKARW